MSGDDTEVKGKDSDKTEELKTNEVASDAKVVGMAGTGVGMTRGAGVGMAGAVVSMAEGGGVGMAGAGVGMAGAGRGVFGTGAKEFSESDGGSDCSDVDQEALESGISDMGSGDEENHEENEESTDTEDNDDNNSDVSFMNPRQLRQSPIIVKEPIKR